MSKTRSSNANAAFLARTLQSSLIAQLLAGCFMSFPGASMDVLLKQFKWTEGDFGFAILVQGIFGLFGNFYANWRVKNQGNIETDLRLAISLVGFGALIAYFWEFPANAIFATEYIHARIIGYAFIGFGVGLLAIVNNTRALQSKNPGTALMLVAFTFTFGAVIFPFVTSAHLASLTNFTTHNWKFVLLPVLILTVLSLLVPIRAKKSVGEKLPETNLENKYSKSKAAKSTTATIYPWNLGLQLFFYIGIEVNLTIGFALLLMRVKGIEDSVSRFAPSALWLGILVSRLVTTLLPLPVERFGRWTWQLAIMLGILLSINIFIPTTSISLSMAVIFVTGLIMGPFYGIIVGQAAYLWKDVNIERNAAKIATFGSAGYIFLPFLFGQVTDKFGIKIGFVAILLQSVLFAAFSMHTAYQSKKASR